MDMAEKKTSSYEDNIVNIVNQIDSGIIQLAPEFQRKLVWTNAHKESFIDTILSGYPFPEIYIADGDVDLDNPTKINKMVVDGQQRLSTIYQYIKEDPRLELKHIRKYRDLTKEEKQNFCYYNIVIRNLGLLSQDAIREVFKRINSVNYALNAIEITHALYDGEFISTANKILEDEENKKIIERLDVFSINEYSRMRDLEFIITLMCICEEGCIYFATTQLNEIYVKKYNDSYNNKEQVIRLFNRIFNLIDNIVKDSYSLWTKKSNFLTLFIELIRFDKEKQDKKETIDIDKLRKVLSSFEKNLLNSKDSNLDNDFNKYYLASIQSTGSRSSRVTRGKILQVFLANNY